MFRFAQHDATAVILNAVKDLKQRTVILSATKDLKMFRSAQHDTTAVILNAVKDLRCFPLLDMTQPPSS